MATIESFLQCPKTVAFVMAGMMYALNEAAQLLLSSLVDGVFFCSGVGRFKCLT